MADRRTALSIDTAEQRRPDQDGRFRLQRRLLAIASAASAICRPELPRHLPEALQGQQRHRRRTYDCAGYLWHGLLGQYRGQLFGDAEVAAQVARDACRCRSGSACRSTGAWSARSRSKRTAMTSPFRVAPAARSQLGSHVKAQHYFDLAATYTLFDMVNLRAGVNNIFDKIAADHSDRQRFVPVGGRARVTPTRRRGIIWAGSSTPARRSTSNTSRPRSLRRR